MKIEENFIKKHLLDKKTYTEYTGEELLYFGSKEIIPTFQIMIRPTEFCNFSCEYCFSYSKNKNNCLSKEQLDIFSEKIKDIKNKSFYIHGGEPLSYKNLFYLLEKIQLKNEPILIQTNLKLLTEEHIYKFKDFKNLKFAVSVHQGINPKEYLEKFKWLTKYNLLGRIEVMYTTSNPINKTIYKVFKNIYSNTDIYSIFNEMGMDIPNINTLVDKNYLIKTNKNEYEATFDDFYKKGLNYSFKGMGCSAGYQGFLLNWDGNIYRCQADLFIYQKPLTNINKFEILKENKICLNDCCLCDLEFTRIKYQEQK